MTAKTVLMVDDEFDSVTLLKSALERSGHCVLYAQDLTAALATLNQTQIDWVFIDLSLDCEIPELLQRFYNDLQPGNFNEGQALGTYLWRYRNGHLPSRHSCPGYAYLSCLADGWVRASNPAVQELGNAPERFVVDKFYLRGLSIVQLLETCLNDWNALQP